MGSQFQKCGNTDCKIGFELCNVQGERGEVVCYVANPGALITSWIQRWVVNSQVNDTMHKFLVLVNQEEKTYQLLRQGKILQVV